MATETTPTSWPSFTFDEVVRGVAGVGIGTPPARCDGVSTDSRALARGNVFVALRGEKFDGHAYLAAAAEAGAACAIVESRWLGGAGLGPATGGGPEARSTRQPAPTELAQRIALVAVPDTLTALGALARFHRRRFPRLPVAAVTGSNGKTTTKEMLAAILAAARGPVLKTEGNLNNEVGVPRTLFELRPEHAAAVVEMGMNHPGEIARLAAVAEPKLGLVTFAGTAHIEHLGSRDAIADAKAELYLGLPPDGIAVANADDARMLARARACGRRLITFGREHGADVRVVDVAGQDASGLAFTLGIGTREVEVRLPIVGVHNALNAAAAAAAAVALGCSDREIARGLAGVQTVGRRLRIAALPSGALLIDDCYNANPDSMAAALRTLREMSEQPPPRRRVAVLGDMLELGSIEAQAHAELGALAAKEGVALLACFGPRSRATAGAAKQAGLDAFHTEDVDALVAFVRERLAKDDLLLVKASRGMKLERLVEALG